MGGQEIRKVAEGQELRAFTQRVLNDLRALERMHAEGLIESDVRRIGAEQELFLVDSRGRPASRALELLEAIGDDHFTTELASFNLEFNLDPLQLGGDCLSRLQDQLESLLERARTAAARCGVRVVMTGILPSLVKSDLSLENMTPRPRYRALNDAMNRVRGGRYQLYIKGKDELIVTHDNVMLEACNTSFQVHFQVTPEEFARRYNIAQAVAAPVLAAATNSPLLFGRQLWRETRIALFQQSVDTRSPADMREQRPRVSFGHQWVKESVLEIFREDITRFRVLIANDSYEDPFASLAAGEPPALTALRLHNGTVYRWNRPCYGISDGRPHLRIENRVFPAGPTVLDEIANAAFWFGLMSGVAQEHDDITRVMDFDVAKENFIAAARLGLGAQFEWPGIAGPVPAKELVLRVLLDLARAGLERLDIDRADIDRYLGIIGERVGAGRTGSQWLIDSYKGMESEGRRTERLAALVLGTARRQEAGDPVSTWKAAHIEEAEGRASHYSTVGQLMTTDLFTVNQDELVDLVAYLMDWRHIRHVPVEDAQHRLVGLVTHRSILRLVAQNLALPRNQPIPVSDVMQREVLTVTPETSLLDAITTMKKHRISCLPVVNDDEVLVGIITERDFMGIAGELLERHLAER